MNNEKMEQIRQRTANEQKNSVNNTFTERSETNGRNRPHNGQENCTCKAKWIGQQQTRLKIENKSEPLGTRNNEQMQRE